jgi:serine/threonine-protein kinase
MELFDGTPLEIRPPSTIPDILDTFTQSAQGLKALHNAGWLHCDIKPNNILRSDSGVVKIIDFGQACKIGTTKERIQGTPDYIAPEQVARRPLSIKTDVFNLGATLYWVLTGRNIPTLYTVNKKGTNNFVLHATIPNPTELNPRVPAALSQLAMEMVATVPTKRPDMDEVMRRLDLVRHQLATQKPAPGPAGGTPAPGSSPP